MSSSWGWNRWIRANVDRRGSRGRLALDRHRIRKWRRPRGPRKGDGLQVVANSSKTGLPVELLWLASLGYRSAKGFVSVWRFPFGFWAPTSVVNVATKLRDGGGIVDRIRAHSPKSFLPNALMSCSRESSRAASDVIVGIDPVGTWRSAPDRRQR